MDCTISQARQSSRHLAFKYSTWHQLLQPGPGSGLTQEEEISVGGLGGLIINDGMQFLIFKRTYHAILLLWLDTDKRLSRSKREREVPAI